MPFAVGARQLTLCLMGAVLCACTIAHADYLIDVWDTDSGLPNSSVTAIAQTPDGYLWVGTYNGLARFDGVRFISFDPINTPALGHARVQDLLIDASGTLWINTYRGGLTSYRNGELTREREGLQSDIRTYLAHSSSQEVTFVTQLGQVMRKNLRQPSDQSWQTLPHPTGERLTYGAAEPDGTLWFMNRARGLVKLSGTNYQTIPQTAFPFPATINVLALHNEKRILAGCNRGVLAWTGDRFIDVTPTNAEPQLPVTMVIPVPDGAFWVLANGRLRKQVGRTFVAEAPDDWRGLLGPAGGRVIGSHVDPAGGVWLNHYGNGLFHISPAGLFERITSSDGLPGDRVWAWCPGREGDVWVGIDRGGLARLRERRFHVLGPEQGLGARAALSVCEGENGIMYFGTSGGGLCQWRPGSPKSIPVSDEPSDNFVFSVLARANGGLWLSAAAGEDLHIFDGAKVIRADWEEHGVKAILTDTSGRVWFGEKSGLSWRLDDVRKLFRASDGMPPSAVRAIAEAPDKSIWCGNDDGMLFRSPDGEKLEIFQPPDSRAGQQILSLLADRDGTIWAGTFGNGLLRLKAGRFSRITAKEGLPGEVVCQIIEDADGQIWMGTHQGLCRVSRQSLNDCADGKTRHLDLVTYGRLDGLPTLEFAGNYQPACWKSRDGRLWFASVKGMVSVEPDKMRKNTLPPPVIIEELRVDGDLLDISQKSLQIAPGHKQYHFRFTALSFIAPDKVRFRYQLEGLDPDWVEAGTRREAQYSHIPHGAYTFTVLACNNDGVWNQNGSRLQLRVLPYFYQTWWFMLSAGLAVVGGGTAMVRRIATRKYRMRLARLQEQHAIELDRSRIAKDIHDDLGAGLTQIILLSELARRAPADQNQNLERICDSARKMTRAMDEIVWAVDPQHDTLPGLMDYASAFAEDFLRVAGLRCRLEIPPEIPPLRVDAESRYNTFLALKETLNNVVKHAEATEVWLRLTLLPGGFSLTIEDNGKGLPLTVEGEKAETPARISVPSSPEPASAEPIAAIRLASGKGLPNLVKRLESVGGKCEVTSAPGQGTRVAITVQAGVEASPIVASSHKPL